MVVKMAKWSPWPPALPATKRKFQVKIKSFRLEGIGNIFEWKTHAGYLALKVKWKGEPRKFGLHNLVSKQRCREDLSQVKLLEEGQSSVTWEDEFENKCCLSSTVSRPWRISFHVLLGDSDVKLVTIGRGSVKLSEVAAKMESDIQWRVPVSLRVAEKLKEVSLLVNFTIAEIRDSPVLAGTEHDSIQSKNRTSQKHIDSDEPETSLVDRSDSSWFSWKRHRMSVRQTRSKDEPLFKKSRSWNFGSIVDSVFPSSNQQKIGEFSEPSDESTNEADQTTGAWEPKEVISRDGSTKLKSDVFFATFDQRSDKATGESACTALVAVISHWLHSNSGATPTRQEFDDLIVQGSSEWRKLCDDTSHLNHFPNKHFDLETVLHAGIRPVDISRENSFVGFFLPENFASLTGVMSFDHIWQKIVTPLNGDDNGDNNQPRVYIISWNDHFFVLKIDHDAYYIIDTLGERLFEGCEKAYVLKFDDSSLMLQNGKDNGDGDEMIQNGKSNGDGNGMSQNGKTNGDGEGDEKIISRGKECCKEFIVRFLAAIPLEELLEQEKKEEVSYFSLHQRLQIEFNLTYMLSSSSSPSSSLSSSPFSSSVSTPSRL